MDLRCSICGKDFDEFQRLPRLVPECGHSYCSSCIKKATLEKKNVFVCPIDNQSHIFRRENDQLPKNIVLIKAIRDLKSQTLTKSRNNAIIKKYQGDIRNQNAVCEEHQKPLQFKCLLDGQVICPHCALFGAHKGHQLQNLVMEKASQELGELLERAGKGIEMLLDQSATVLETPNIFVKSIDGLRRNLRAAIKETFKAYHDVINRREVYVEKELDEMIKTWQHQMEPVQDRVFDTHKTVAGLQDHFRLLQSEGQHPRRDPHLSVLQLQQILSKSKKLNTDIDNLKEDMNGHCREYQSQYKQKLSSNKFFKIQEISADMTISECNRNKKDEHDVSYLVKNRPPSHSIISDSREEIPKKENMLPPKHNALAMTRFASTNKSRMKSGHGSQAGHSLAKSTYKEEHSIDAPSRHGHGSPSPQQRDKQEKRTYGKAQIKKKVSSIIQLINKVEGGSLQLIGLQLKDYHLQDILEYIKKSGKKFGLIKLVKNEITDEGLGIILDSVRNYEYLHTLNLTSNCLTEGSLDLILGFSEGNRALKNFYLRNNSINVLKTKEKKKRMFDEGINIFY